MKNKMTYSIQKDSKTNIDYITLENGNLQATFLNFGARWHNFIVPDKKGLKENILLSLDTPESILKDPAQFGALVGPVAGRIKDAKWNGIPLEKNNGDHHIHGGSQGWWCQFWDYSLEETSDSVKVIFSLTDTKSGYPGPIHVINTYELTTESVVMTTSVVSEAATIVNPTNHVYFNLSGNAKEKIKNHELFINSQEKIETDMDNIPTGKITSLEGTGYDFSTSKKIGDSLSQIENGIDDAYLLKKENPQVILYEPTSGRTLRISSDRDAVVLFSTTGFNDNFKVNGQNMSSELGLAIETQELPDIVNHPKWGNIDLQTGVTKTYRTEYNILTN